MSIHPLYGSLGYIWGGNIYIQHYYCEYIQYERAHHILNFNVERPTAGAYVVLVHEYKENIPCVMKL